VHLLGMNLFYFSLVSTNIKIDIKFQMIGIFKSINVAYAPSPNVNMILTIQFNNETMVLKF
jgi:hypothetical protein